MWFYLSIISSSSPFDQRRKETMNDLFRIGKIRLDVGNRTNFGWRLTVRREDNNIKETLTSPTIT